jgi:Ca2+-binding EF-hand superfamily protein
VFHALSSECPKYLANKSQGLSFYEFLPAVHKSLYSKDAKEQMKFIFSMYDCDNDGIIGTHDL